MVRRANVKKTVLTHISRKYRDFSGIEKFVSGYENIVVAEDFMEIDL
jgi:ribonuclease BN (tRNA processing enzyme)